MYSETRVCIICKKTFEAHNPNQRLCSDKCISIRSAAQQRKYYAREAKHKTKPIYSKPKAEPKEIHIPSVSLHIAAWKAKLSGKSYGKAEAKIPVEKPNLSIPGDPRCPAFLNLGRVILI